MEDEQFVDYNMLKRSTPSLQARLIQLQSAPYEAEQATEETKCILKKCREEQNIVKTALSEYELENDKLQCEKEQLNQCLEMQRHHAGEQINKLKKKVKKKEKDLQQSNQINDELNKILEEIESKRTEFPVRERNDVLQQKEKNKILTRENESLRTAIYEYENKQAENKKEHIEIEQKFKVEINNLQIKYKRASEKVRKFEKDLEERKSKSEEQQAIFDSKQCQFEKTIKALRSQTDEKLKSTELRCYTSVGGKSDTEKDNISLKSELTVALDRIEKIKQEYSDLSEKYETGKIASERTIKSLQQEKTCLEQEKVNFRAKLDHIQSDLNRFKNEQVHQQDSSHGTIDNLLRQNRQLDKDRELLRGKIFSLENDKIKLEDMLNKSKEDDKKLKRDHDKLQDNLREKSNELKDSEVRLRKLEASILFLQNTKTENEQLKESLHELEGVKREFDNLDKRLTGEKPNQYSTYEAMQNKKDLETCKHQKKALEDERNELQEENIELDNELQCRIAISKLHEAERQMRKQNETIEDQKQEKREIYKEKNDLENKLRLASNNEEQASLGKECEKLLHDKLKELNKLKSRFHELVDSKETSEVLIKKVENLQQKNSELNQRLVINNKEKSSLHKENKELKNILQDKLSKVKRLEARVMLSKEEKVKLKKDNADLKHKLQSLKKKLKEFENRCIPKVLETERNIKELENTIEDLRDENRNHMLKLEKFNEEKTEFEKQLRLKDDKVELLYNSLEKERPEHESAMKRLEMQYTAVQNECFELCLILQNIHNSSEISFEKLGSVIDKNIFRQKLEETAAKENTLAKETNKIMKNFASAKDKKGCIKVLTKRFEKTYSTCDNGIPSDENTDMEDNTTNSSCQKYYDDALTESRSTTTCHNRMNKTTNVFNVNIVSSKVSFNENTEEQLSSLNGSNGQYPAIDEGPLL
ncbi:uncharacterized protein LOC127717552 [Mytilus californianus]|uniref:uncharacterized protein LOC127717552 n=1 Tax=Mytilus californianus TaxID=6549 RepID=UPI002246FED3|nr:uncharacterized protein LOC127717552 [Mytilus californianus]